MDRGVVIQSADLVWRDGQPYARDFGDIYHSADEARETERVFVAPVSLAAKAGQAARAGLTLRIGELGFGTGLNFAVIAALALRSGCRLHFISFDARPIDPLAFAQIARQRRARLPAYASLAGSYPPLLAGWHRRSFAEGRICLSLYWGEAGAGLRELMGRQHQPLDAWLLDGFAPDRNPDMWREDLLQMAANLATSGTVVATFTAAGQVRRRLEACGFAMRRVDQRPQKRESLAGVFTGEGLARQPLPSRVTVAGAGIAGASVARHLAEQGIGVNVYDPATAVAAGASSIPAMLLHPRLLGDRSAQGAWRAHAYAYSRAWVGRFPGFTESGVLQTLGPNLDNDKLRRIASVYAGSGLLQRLSGAEASRLGGWAFADDALHFPGAGIVEPATLIKALLDHPRIALRLGQKAPTTGAFLEGVPPGAALSCEGQAPGAALSCEGQAPRAPRPLVLACAGAARNYPPATFLETVEVQGQVDIVTLDKRPHLAVVGDGYLAPTGFGVVAGATFEHRAWPPHQATGSNLKPLAGHRYRWLARARATRTIASDRTSIIGALAPTLYVSIAHGSMGTVSAPFAGAIIASQITGDFAPLDAAVEAIVAPARFHQRQARRGYRLGATEFMR